MSDPYFAVNRHTEDYQTECGLLAQQIETWRIHKGLSMRKLRKLSDIPISRFSIWRKTGRADPKYTTILRIAKGLDITVEQLLFTTPEAVCEDR